MKKQKNLLIASLICLSIIGAGLTVLYAVKVINLLIYVIFISLDLVLIVANVVLLTRTQKKIKKVELEKKATHNKTTGNYVEDIYAVLGIPIQYNEDGTVKDIYDLLGVEPLYDEQGNRISTPYELLGIMPKFTKEGKEVPHVFVIKNRVNRVAKADLSQRVLTRKLTDREKEELFIRETLKQKLEEAKAQGDKEKEQAIQKVMTTVVKPKKEEKKREDKKAEKPFKIKYSSGNVIQAPTFVWQFKGVANKPSSPQIVNQPSVSNPKLPPKENSQDFVRYTAFTKKKGKEESRSQEGSGPQLGE